MGLLIFIILTNIYYSQDNYLTNKDWRDKKMNIGKIDLHKVTNLNEIARCTPCYFCTKAVYVGSLIKCNKLNKLIPEDLSSCDQLEFNVKIIEDPHIICKICDYCEWRKDGPFGQDYPVCCGVTKTTLGKTYNPCIGSISPCEKFRLNSKLKINQED